MEIKEILKEYWWLSIITVPVSSFILWLIHKKAPGEPIQVGFDGNRSNLVKETVLSILILNFGVWGIGTVALGGDAVNGKREKDKYFLAWKGRYTEVSRGTYLYNYTHTCITIASFPLAIIILSIADIRDMRKKRLTENRE